MGHGRGNPLVYCLSARPARRALALTPGGGTLFFGIAATVFLLVHLPFAWAAITDSGKNPYKDSAPSNPVESLLTLFIVPFATALAGFLAARGRAYYAAHRDELYAQREVVREAAWQAELEALAKEDRKRIAAAENLHAAQVRRQKEFLRSIGIPDLSPEEVTERASVRRGLR
jgi:hypothetical protein